MKLLRPSNLNLTLSCNVLTCFLLIREKCQACSNKEVINGKNWATPTRSYYLTFNNVCKRLLNRLERLINIKRLRLFAELSQMFMKMPKVKKQAAALERLTTRPDQRLLATWRASKQPRSHKQKLTTTGHQWMQSLIQLSPDALLWSQLQIESKTLCSQANLLHNCTLPPKENAL